MLIAIGYPNDNDFKAEMVTTVGMLSYHLGVQGHHIKIIEAESCLVDKNRDEIFIKARDSNVDYLLMIDTDTEYKGWDWFIIDRMIAHGKDVVGSIAHQGKYPYWPCIYNFLSDKDLEVITEWPDKLFKCDAGLGGFFLISKKVLQAFDNNTIIEKGFPFNHLFDGRRLLMREDLAFCWRLKELGLEVWVDPNIDIVHHKYQGIVRKHWETSKEYMQKQGIPVEKQIGIGIRQ